MRPHTAGELDRPWSQIAADSHWTDDQWLYMTRHIWLTSIGAGLALLASAAWLAASDTTRQRAHLPTLLALLIAMGFIGTGAWYAGEGVYRMGVAVRAPEPGVPAASAEHQAEKGSAARLNYFAPPLQTHVLAAGLMAALGLAAVAATLRRWSATSRSSIGDTSELQLTGDDLHPVESRDASGEPLPRGGAFVPPARFWLLALLAGAAAATAGLWTAEDFSLSMFKDVLTKADVRADNRILFLHILLGLSLVALTLFLAILTRASRGLKLIAGLLMLAVLAAAGFQVWMGIKLMYGG